MLLEGPPAPPSPVPEVNELEEDHSARGTSAAGHTHTDGFGSALTGTSAGKQQQRQVEYSTQCTQHDWYVGYLWCGRVCNGTSAHLPARLEILQSAKRAHARSAGRTPALVVDVMATHKHMRAFSKAGLALWRCDTYVLAAAAIIQECAVLCYHCRW